MKPSVLILYNQPIAKEGIYSESEAGVLDEVASVKEALELLKIPHRVVGVDVFADISKILAQSAEQVVFNLVEGFHESQSDANHVPTLCRSFGKGCTGGDTHTLTLAFDKWQSKLLLQSMGLPVPKAAIVPVGRKVQKSQLPPGPYIVKPVAADASEGIDSHSVVAKPGTALDKVVAQIHTQFGQSALVEQFVGKRELNVSVVQMGDEVRVMPLAEIDFSTYTADKPRIVCYKAKWIEDSFEYQNTPRIIPAPISQKVAQHVRQCALDTWHALGCQDYARVDFRLDEKGRPFIMEANPNPDISSYGGFVAALAAGHISYAEFVEAMVTNAASRIGIGGMARSELWPCEHSKAHGSKLTARSSKIRYAAASDRKAVHEFIKATNFFRPDEVDVAMEVFDDALKNGPDGHYQSYVIDENKKPVGWVCFGPTPCTIGTYDLYWIAVDPACQSKGYGRILMTFAEQQIKKHGGRLVIVETSGRPSYIATRKFYLKIGYLESSRVWDFYAPGDDKIIYIKRL
jgi:D-alanine-D-alanine ligase